MPMDPRTRDLLKRLAKHYPHARIELEFRNPLELLVATILAAQCTDARVNQVTRSLFQRYPSARAYAEADTRALEEAIRPTGFFKAKARSIQNCCRRLVEVYGGRVPDRMEDLLTLPGVGRKTANIILGNAFGKEEGFPVDTHVGRVAGRLGLSQAKTPERIEEDLCRRIPRKQWTRASHLLIFHGRYTCKARAPLCHQCPVTAFCVYEGKRV